MSRSLTCFEIVQFSFKSDVQLRTQIDAMKQLGRWVAEQPGFLARQSYHEPQADRWTDVVEWQTKADAHAAMQRSQREASLAVAMALISTDTLHVGHYEKLL
jgi:heme-degrading monooxygenase HmoA